DRQMVDAGRRRFRRRDSAHRDRQDSKNRPARPVQGLRAAERGGLSLTRGASNANRGHPFHVPRCSMIGAPCNACITAAPLVSEDTQKREKRVMSLVVGWVHRPTTLLP